MGPLGALYGNALRVLKACRSACGTCLKAHITDKHISTSAPHAHQWPFVDLLKNRFFYPALLFHYCQAP